MRRFLMVSALAASFAAPFAGAAFASSDDLKVDAPRDQWLTTAQVAEKFTAQGYDVRRVKVEKGIYEVYAVDKGGKKLELYVHPVSGAVLKQGEGD